MGCAVGAGRVDAGGGSVTALQSVTLSTRDRDWVTRVACVITGYHLETETDAFALEAQIQAAALSSTLRRTLLGFRRFGDASGGLLLRDVPLGDVPPTPDQPRAQRASTSEAEAAMSLLLAGLGEQYGFRPELGGRIIQDIVPVRGFETQQISMGSAVDLECHVEMAFSPYRSDYVALLCLRQDHDRVAGTTISSIDRMLPLLDPATIQTLRQPRFRTKVDASFRTDDDLPGDVWVDPICVLGGPLQRPHLRVDFAETEATDPAARAALSALRDVAERTRILVHMRAGDLLVVDNHRALHGRTPFAPRYDGADRWLLRSFITKDLRRSEGVRDADARIVEVDYLVRRNRSGHTSGGDLVEHVDHPVRAQLRSDLTDQI